MQIKSYKANPHYLAQLVDLVNYCQNIEAHLGITMAEQADIFAIEQFYQRSGGNFWLALDDDNVVGSIALMPIDRQNAVLKKFFTYPKYRGQPVRLGAQLYTKLATFARRKKLAHIVLDTPEAEHRSHTFYERQGFKQIAAGDLTVKYRYPDRNSRIYQLDL